MKKDTIKCPGCGAEIPIEEALLAKARLDVAPELQKELDKKISAVSKKENELDERSVAVDQRASQLVIEKESHDKLVKTLVDKQVKEDLNKLSVSVTADAEEKVELKVRGLEEAAKTREDTLKELKEFASDEQDKRIAAETIRDTAELKHRGLMQAATAKGKKQGKEEVATTHRLEVDGLKKTLADTEKKLLDAQKTAGQGSQQLQGEVQELDLESALKARFPLDKIEPVPQGVKGADVLQRVYSSTGDLCGTIIWESKNQKSWNNNWVTKLKEDQLDQKAQVAIIYTSVLPKDVQEHSTAIDGVWVVDHTVRFLIAEVLRSSIIEIARTNKSAVGKNRKMELLYSYLTGTEFSQTISIILQTYTEMDEQLAKEKRAAAKGFAKRDKHLEKVEQSLSGMYGSLQGIAGASLPEIEELELDLEVKALPASSESAEAPVEATVE